MLFLFSIVWCSLVYSGLAISTDLSTFTTGAQGLRLIGEDENQLAYSVANVGDFDQDGIDDFVVGAPFYDMGGGLALIILGGDFSSATEIDAATFASGSRGMRVLGGRSVGGMLAGWSVGAAGDINNDGYDDALVGTTAFTGVIYVIFGTVRPYSDILLESFIAGTSGFRIVGPPESYLSSDVLSLRGNVGDLNGDGYNDMAVSSSQADDLPKFSCGAVWIIFGQPSTTTVSDIILSNLESESRGIHIAGAASNDFTGVSIANAGDVNGDSINDLLVGGLASPEQDFPGAVYLIYGSHNMTSWDLLNFTTGSAGVRFLGEDGSRLGQSVTSIGDINDDGLADFAMSAPYARPLSRFRAGIIYVIYGSRTVQSADVSMASFSAGSRGYAIYGNVNAANLGSSISAAGDQNQDGVPDLLIAASGTSSVYIMYTSAAVRSTNIDLATSSWMRWTFALPADDTAQVLMVDGGKDFNGDGHPDLLLGSSSAAVTPAAGGAVRRNGGVAFALIGPFIPTTSAPSEAPTAEPSIRTYDFHLYVRQIVYFVTRDSYYYQKDISDAIMANTVADCLDGVGPSALYSFYVEERAGQNESCFLHYSVLVQASPEPFDVLRLQLIDAVHSGAMNRSLHAYIAEFGAYELANAVFDVPEVSATPFEEDGSSDDALLGVLVIAAITYGIFLVVVLLVLTVYRLCTSEQEEKIKMRNIEGFSDLPAEDAEGGPSSAADVPTSSA